MQMRKRLPILISPVLLLCTIRPASAFGPPQNLSPLSEAGWRLLRELVEWAIILIEGAGIFIIVFGAALASAVFLRRYFLDKPATDAYYNYRSQLGRAILLGLEFFVAADIIRTVVIEPSFANVGILGLVVLIRTFLSFALDVEINGHWPWRDSEYAARRIKSPADFTAVDREAER
jgi:uncharacterized membrane protein